MDCFLVYRIVDCGSKIGEWLGLVFNVIVFFISIFGFRWWLGLCNFMCIFMVWVFGFMIGFIKDILFLKCLLGKVFVVR